MVDASVELRKGRKMPEREVLKKVKMGRRGKRTAAEIGGFGWTGDVGVDEAIMATQVSLRSERQEFLDRAKRSDEIHRGEMFAFAETETLKMKTLGKINLGNFELGEGEEKRKQRTTEIVELIGAEHLVDLLVKQEVWVIDDDGEFGEAAWQAAIKLRDKVRLDELTDGEYNAWVYLKAWGEVLEEFKMGVDPRKLLIEYQQVLSEHEIDVETVLTKDGRLKFKDGMTVGEKEAEWKKLHKRSKGHFDVEFEEFMNDETGEMEIRMKAITGPDEEPVREPNKVNLGAMVRKMGEQQFGVVVDRYCATEMNTFINPDFVSNERIPVRYTLASNGDKEGMVFPDIFTDPMIDQMITGLDAAGYKMKWEAIGRLGMGIESIIQGFHENRLEKQFLDKLPKLGGASMMLLLAEMVPGFAEAVMHGALTGTRHAKNGQPTRMEFDKNTGKYKIPSSGDEKITELKWEPKDSRLREQLRQELQAKFKADRKKFEPWAVELAWAFLWSIGEGMEIPWTVNKTSRAEHIVYWIFGANVQIFYEFPGPVVEKDGILIPREWAKKWDKKTEESMSTVLGHIDRANDWEAGTANAKAVDILRWLMPAVIAYGTHLTEVMKFMALGNRQQDIVFSSGVGRMPAYDDLTKIDRSKLPKDVTMENIHEIDDPMRLPEEIRHSDEYKRLVMMRALKFKGPFKNIEEQFKRDVLLRERRRWLLNFGLKFGTNEKIRGLGISDRILRILFHHKDNAHRNGLIDWVVNKKKKDEEGNETDGPALEKLKLLGFKFENEEEKVTDEVIADLFEHEETVLGLANEIHQRLGWDLNINKKSIDGAKNREKDQKNKFITDFVNAHYPGKNEERDKIINAVKLELVLRDLDTWGMRADLTKLRSEEGSWRERLLDLATKVRGGLDALHYKWAYHYVAYKTIFKLIGDWPEMLKIDGIDKALEELRNAYHEYGRASGFTPHPINTITMMELLLTVAGIVNETKAGSGKRQLLRPADSLESLGDMVDDYWIDEEALKYIHF